ncbi:hypothetical protein ACAF76_016080 [Brevibacillus sp. TJ4]|uniref:hypothetical protein n=1 Tax=Brevibacillus sp. TJ4 TaxID=3234853 RepID=UPI0037CFCC53
MTYNQFFNQPTQAFQSGFSQQSAGAMFQPGFAGTNAQEVQQQNQPQFSQVSSAGTYGFSNAGGFGGAQAMFQPGFAGTNAQEVRQNNMQSQQNQGAQQQFGGFGQFQQPSYQSAFSGQAGSIFSPGFAGTNVQEVQARNNNSFGGYGLGSFAGASGFGLNNQATNSIFSPQFAGTNVQEVRQQNQLSAQNQTGYGGQFQQQQQYQQQQQQFQPQQQFQSFANSAGIGMNPQAMFQSGFAGTNPQEVRAHFSPFGGSLTQGSF